MKIEYKQRDVEELEPFFSAHLNAMTEQNLNSKRDIAAELAFRDMEIEGLNDQVDELESEIEYLVLNWEH